MVTSVALSGCDEANQAAPLFVTTPVDELLGSGTPRSKIGEAAGPEAGRGTWRCQK